VPLTKALRSVLGKGESFYPTNDHGKVPMDLGSLVSVEMMGFWNSKGQQHLAIEVNEYNYHM
jgi:hypothetical protein